MLFSRLAAAALAAALVAAPAASVARASERDALDISRNVQALHVPNGTVIDPVFTSPTSSTVDHYTRGGDSALWTGHYLAAEAFRYRTTKAPDALANAKRALRGLKTLLVVTKSDVLARCILPVDWEEGTDRRAVITEEAGHGIYPGTVKGRDYYWVGNTSRDQYCGVFFGLSVAYESIDETADPKVRSTVRNIVNRLLTNLTANDWAVKMPDGSVSTIFAGRFDQQLSFLQVGRQANPQGWSGAYEQFRKKNAALVVAPILVDAADDHNSYFKFNLDYITFYDLIRLEEPNSRYRPFYEQAYRVLRDATRAHGNAHFNMIDRAVAGLDAARDAETRLLLDEWLERPRRDGYVDLRGKYPSCGQEDRACAPIPVPERVRTDFVWQRSPFLLYGGSDGTTETAGIDYILPYWMARAYSVILE